MVHCKIVEGIPRDFGKHTRCENCNEAGHLATKGLVLGGPIRDLIHWNGGTKRKQPRPKSTNYSHKHTKIERTQGYESLHTTP